MAFLLLDNNMGDISDHEAYVGAVRYPVSVTALFNSYRRTISEQQSLIRDLEDEIHILRSSLQSIASAIPPTLRDPSDNFPVTLHPGTLVPPKRTRVSTALWWETQRHPRHHD